MLVDAHARARGMSNCKLTDRGLPCNEITLERDSDKGSLLPRVRHAMYALSRDREQ